MFGRISVPLVVAAGLAVAGCSIAIPIPSLMGSDDAVGSIKAPAVLSTRLQRDDLRQAHAALTVALETSADVGAPAVWRNPRSGAKGSFRAGAAADADHACRPFRATVEVPGAAAETVDGSACRSPEGTWAIDAITARTSG